MKGEIWLEARAHARRTDAEASPSGLRAEDGDGQLQSRRSRLGVALSKQSVRGNLCLPLPCQVCSMLRVRGLRTAALVHAPRGACRELSLQPQLVLLSQLLCIFLRGDCSLGEHS